MSSVNLEEKTEILSDKTEMELFIDNTEMEIFNEETETFCDIKEIETETISVIPDEKDLTEIVVYSADENNRISSKARFRFVYLYVRLEDIMYFSNLKTCNLLHLGK